MDSTVFLSDCAWEYSILTGTCSVCPDHSLASVLTLFIAVSLQGVIGKYGLPFLSIPFCINCLDNDTCHQEHDFLSISERGIFTMNELYTLGGDIICSDCMNGGIISSFIKPLKIYFISLGSNTLSV